MVEGTAEEAGKDEELLDEDTTLELVLLLTLLLLTTLEELAEEATEREVTAGFAAEVEMRWGTRRVWVTVLVV